MLQAMNKYAIQQHLNQLQPIMHECNSQHTKKNKNQINTICVPNTIETKVRLKQKVKLVMTVIIFSYRK